MKYKILIIKEIDDILSELTLWNINYHISVDNILFISFKYPDRINHFEIDTINKVLLKLSSLPNNFLNIIHISFPIQTLLTKNLFTILKIPNNLKLITPDFILLSKYFPNIKYYFDNLFDNIVTKSNENSYFFIKDNIVLVEHNISETVCNRFKIYNIINFNLSPIEKNYIVKDILKIYLNINPNNIINSMPKYSWAKITDNKELLYQYDQAIKNFNCFHH